MCLTEWLPIKEAAAQAGVGTRAFRHRAKRLGLTKRTIAGRAHWHVDDVAAVIAAAPPKGRPVTTVRYVCESCGKTARGPVALPACPHCVRLSLRDRDRVELVKCLVCDSTTAERKPYCSDHVDQAPYVAWLLGELGHSY